jgi:hypothetical protein
VVGFEGRMVGVYYGWGNVRDGYSAAAVLDFFPGVGKSYLSMEG